MSRFYTTVHSPYTHHRALLSASTSARHGPRSPHLMIVSHTIPSEEPRVSAFFMSLRILPLGVWIPSFAGLAGMIPFCSVGDIDDPSLGLCRTANTNVLLAANLAHCGCDT